MSTHFVMEDNADIRSPPTNDQILAQLDGLLSTNHFVPVDWNVVNSLLQCIMTDSETPFAKYKSTQDDPMGRLLLTGILSRNPPVAIVDTAIRIFPHSLDQNPGAFFAASQNAGPEILTCMARHVSGREVQCPYPWLLSESTSVEQAKTILETFPEGVLKPSPFLSSFNLIDYLLMSPAVVKSRTFDLALWTKFKLVLVAAGCSDKDICPTHNCTITPVQVILKRVLSRSGMYGGFLFLDCQRPDRLAHFFQTASNISPSMCDATGYQKTFGIAEIG